ncbi:MAG: hydroxymethylbilane synthase [Chloroflexi bacterium]|nr:hydroxymethylbilane synthase [Chloroflexota bacterium]
MQHTFVIGTRASALALWQSEWVAAQLHRLYPELQFTLKRITTKGDRIVGKPLPEIGGKGLFTAELEEQLRTGEIDLAVHSLKDLPTDLPEDLVIGAVPQRADPLDVLVSRHNLHLVDLPAGAAVGTGSKRRAAQLLVYRPDLHILPLRGNVDTRLRKAQAAPYDAIILAQAGLIRLGRADAITEVLPATVMLPAPGQGALAVECRAADDPIRTLLRLLHHEGTAACVMAERAFLAGLGGGCQVPVAAYAEAHEDTLHLWGLVAGEDGREVIRVAERGTTATAGELGFRLAAQARDRGAEALLGK